jgi:hypothetical protein
MILIKYYLAVDVCMSWALPRNSSALPYFRRIGEGEENGRA